MKKVLFGLFVCLPLVTSASSYELFVSHGEAKWKVCGEGVGCWRQPPLDYEFKLIDNTASVGIIFNRHIGIQYSDWGTVGVVGDYVDDSRYDSHHRRVIGPTAVYRSNVNQHTTGFTLFYTDKYRANKLAFTWKTGLTLVRQNLWWNSTRHYSKENYSHRETNHHRITPVAGIGFFFEKGKFSAGLSLDYIHRPRYEHSPAGGGGNGPGLRTEQIEIRYEF